MSRERAFPSGPDISRQISDVGRNVRQLPNNVVRPPRAILELLRDPIRRYRSPIAIDFWGASLIGQPRRTTEGATIFFRHPGVLRKLILSHDELFLIQAWLMGLISYDGDFETVIDFVEYLLNYPLPPLLAAQAWIAALQLPTVSQPVAAIDRSIAFDANGTRSRDDRRKVLNIEHHYDNGEDFYKLFLDPQLVYSCAHFEAPDMDLAQAQIAKLDIICRKLLLKPGESFLDVGCGWGALLFHAAEHYGVTAHGITLSKRQFDYCTRRLGERKLSGRVSVSLLDYKDLPSIPAYDKIASVGMIEHVGLRNYKDYFSNLLRALKPNGLFLCHGIMTHGQSDSNNFSAQFIQRYVFPGASLANLPDTLAATRRSGWEVVDVDAWRPHYAKTLRCWVDNLRSNEKRAVQLVGDAKVKLWLLFMLCSARGFESNYLGINQILLRRHEDANWNLPMNRAWLV